MKLRPLLRVAVLNAACPTIGGQAVLEGVMMRSPKSFAVAVRRPDGAIVVREEAWLSFAARLPFLKWPLLRGATMLIESLYNGMSALQFSAEIAGEQPPQAAAPDAVTAPPQAAGAAVSKAAMAVTIAVSLAFAFLLFKGLPHLTATLLGLTVDQPLFHIVAGAGTLCVFIGYILLISRLNDVRRLFMYHGAEHKSVHAYEKNVALDVDHTRLQSTAHPRCGTSLILLVIVTSILVFAPILPLVPKVSDIALVQNLFTLLLKIPLMLPVAGLAYEAQRLAAKHPGNLLVQALISPGMLMQKLTTRQPGDRELEVALAALQKTLWRESRLLAEDRTSQIDVYADFDDVVRRLAPAAQDARVAA